MKKAFAIMMLLCFTTSMWSIEVRYTPDDSIKVERILTKLSRHKNMKTADLFVEAAKQFIGTPYVGGTLDKEKRETTTVNIGEVDCTTLVEQALALTKTIKDDRRDFETFCKNLTTIRYRDGKCNGYADRLHYFTQWVADGTKKGIMKEIGGKEFSAGQQLRLDFMSTHADKYMQLANDSALTAIIASHEQPFRDIKVPYLSKNTLNRKKLPVRNGDIIALVTTIDGLDVTHMGIAVWVKGKLHLLHASSKEKRVILDKTSLHDYLAPRKSAPGIRIVRVL